MGACAGCSLDRKSPVILDKYDTCPEGTENLKDKPLPQLHFSAQLKKVKIKRCPMRSISMKFRIEEVEEFLLPVKQFHEQTAKWQLDHIFNFSIDEYQMRKKFLVIEFIEPSTDKVIGSLKINLFLLATGPFHQDFAIDLKPKDSKSMAKTHQKLTPRLSFDLKISQIIKMKLEFLQAQMIPVEKEYPGDKFAFSVRSVTGQSTKYTNQSYVVSLTFEQDEKPDFIQTPQNHFRQQSERTIDEIQSPTKRPKKLKSIKSLLNKEHDENQRFVNRKNIVWSVEECPTTCQMPNFSTEIALYDMHSSAFHIIYWQISSNSKVISSESFVSINKLLSFEPKLHRQQQTMIDFDERIIQLQQKNWLHGKEIGSSLFLIKFSLQKHIKQMQVCVRTQLGVLKSSPVFSNQEAKTGSKEINELESLSIQVQNLFIELVRVREQSLYQSRGIIQEIVELLNQQEKILKTSVKESVMFFNYKSEKQLLKCQEQLIEIGFRAKNYINENIEDVSLACYSLLSVLMKRGELGLAYIGFKSEQTFSNGIVESGLYGDTHNTKSSNADHPFLQKKILIALKYQELLNHLMILALFCLNFKGHETQKQFAELFCALAYFRLPAFRRHILRSISRDDDPDIQEWRGTQFDLVEKTNHKNSRVLDHSQRQKNTYELLFDWQRNFYKYIQTQQKYKKNVQELETVLHENEEWEIRIQKRKGAFFSFVRYWCDYVESITINSKNLKWKHFPGYNKILHAFLVQIKTTKLSEYSDRMEKACVSMLHNEKLLNTFVVILFKKSDLNDPISVMKTLKFLEMFFSKICQKNRKIPTTFDYIHFLKGLKLILECSHGYMVARTLLVLYDNFQIFSTDFKYYLSMLLMGKLFFRLFLHWSKNVRLVFQHLLYIRIYKLTELSQQRTLKVGLFSLGECKKIMGRYEKLMRILENAAQIKKRVVTTAINKYDERDYYKKMKKKLYNRRKDQLHKSEETDIVEEAFKDLVRIPRRSSFANSKFIEELSRPKLQRYQSEVMSNKVKVAIQMAKERQKKDEIIPIKSNNAIAIETESPEIQIRTNSKSLHNSNGFASINDDDHHERHGVALLQENQCEIFPMTEIQAQYIETSMAEYNQIHKLLIKHLEILETAGKNSQKLLNEVEVPSIKLQDALDYDDIRPQGIEEW